MAAFLASNDKYRGVSCSDDDRSYPSGYQFGRAAAARGRGRAALNRVNGYFKTMIEAIANSKLRRMERELELRGIRFDRNNDGSAARTRQPTSRSR
jgi:hypothetical protein